jgi:FkbM family methyltransferase
MTESATLTDLLQRSPIRNHHGIWWPAFDHNPAAAHAEIVKGLGAVDVIAELCVQRRTVFQAGGNVGLWPERLSRSFKRVLTFEPVPATFKCLERNTRGRDNIERFRSALGSEVGEARMRPSRSAGTWRVELSDDGTYEVPMTTVDSARCTDVDAMALAVEGHEVAVLRGAAETIARCRPIILVEELPRAASAIQAHLRSLGYRMVRAYGRDRIYEYEGARR